jgi:hypothetical protein
MAGITTAAQWIAPLTSGLSVLNSISGAASGTQDTRRQQELSLQQLRADQAESMRQTQENAALDRQKIALQAQEATTERRNALKRAVARQRASFGSSGTGSSGGSAQAVLLGLFDESDEERAQRERMDNLRLGAVDLGVAQQDRINVLQRTQLTEKNKISNLSSGLGLAKSILSSF